MTDRAFTISYQNFLFFWIVFFILLLVSSPTLISFAPIPLSWLVLLFGVFLFFIFIPVNFKLSKEFFYFSIIIVVFLFYTSLTSILRGDINKRILVQTTNSIGYLSLFIFFITPYIAKFPNPKEIIYKIFAYAVVLHSLLVVLFFIFPELRFAIEPIFKLSDFGSGTLRQGWRSVGLGIHVAESISVTHGIGVFIVSRMVIKNHIKVSSGVLLNLIIFGSLVLMNRTGLVVGIIGFFMGILGNNPYAKRPRKRYLLSFFFISLFFFFFLIFLSKNYSIKALDRTLEAYYFFQEHGEFGTSTTDAILGRFLFIPDVPVLFGEGTYGIGQNIPMDRGSDIGYVRLFSGGGIVALFFWFLIPISFVIASHKKLESRSLARFLALVWIVVNIKVLWVMPPGGASVAVAILFVLKYLERREISFKNKDIRSYEA
ncbi:MAG: hypothetical protein ACOCQ4_00850 [bacterium]